MTVSVIIPAYNVAPVISRAVASALAQTRPPLEIIVVDDASTDDTRLVVQRLLDADPRIKLISAESNKGPSHARNLAISHARGEWLAFLDADDAWKPQRLERLVDIALEHEADFVADNQILYDVVAQKECRLGFVADWHSKPLGIEELYRIDTLDTSQPTYPPLKPFVRRAFLEETKVAYDENVRYGEDFKFHAETLFRGAKALLTSEAHYIYSTRVGEFSGQYSPNSHSRPRFDLLVLMSDEIKNKYRPLITPSIADAIEKRREKLHLTHLANVARQFRQSGKYFGYAMHICAHPRLVPFLAARIIRKVARAARGT
jgi:succinoglycan biosynthesis protein ExoO